MCFTLTRSRFRCAFFLHRHHPHPTLGGRSSPTPRRALWVAWCLLDWDTMHKPLTSSLAHVRCYVTRPLFTLPTFDLRLELSRWPVLSVIFLVVRSPRSGHKTWTEVAAVCGRRQISQLICAAVRNVHVPTVFPCTRPQKHLEPHTSSVTFTIEIRKICNKQREQLVDIMNF